MKKQKTFEQSLSELEQIVARLESGELSLEESLEIFERGIAITRECRERLTHAQRRIEVLTTGPDGELNIEESDLDEI